MFKKIKKVIDSSIERVKWRDVFVGGACWVAAMAVTLFRDHIPFPAISPFLILVFLVTLILSVSVSDYLDVLIDKMRATFENSEEVDYL